MVALTPAQQEIAHAPLNARIFLSGPASCGKTTSGIERLRFLLENGIPGSSILMLTPQRTLQEPYMDLLHSPERSAGSEVIPTTIGGLARRCCDLFWPLAAKTAEFANPDRPPVFLTLETSQYYMARLVRPLLDQQGYFDSLTIDRSRLYSQIIDNLNKAAVVGFAHTMIGERLEKAWVGDPAQRRVYADVQDCANRFRQYCLEHNLLDFSLQLEIFMDLLWREPIVHDHLVSSYQHVIYDNVEEDIPRAHDLLREWLPKFDSALLIYDKGGGFRRFLGADIETSLELRSLCDRSYTFDRSFVNSPALTTLANRLVPLISPEPPAPFLTVSTETSAQPGEALRILNARFYPQVLDLVSDEVSRLVKEGLPPSEITILAPYVSDALRFSITNRLQERGIPWRTHRPSRSLHDEPASRALLTLSALAHPQWEIRPPQVDLAHSLMQAIERLDLVRSQLLSSIVYRPRDLSLASFDGIRSNVQDRITYIFGNKYALLREWILVYRSSPPLPLDHFLRKLFGEVLSQPGFGFHSNFDAVRVTASLVESARKFRLALEGTEISDIGREYITVLEEGILSAQHLESWRSSEKEAVLVAPVHTYLMSNRSVSVQFWLDPGSSGWYERLFQPLTHPFVLSRRWVQEDPSRVWTDADEVRSSQDALAYLIVGLLRRTRTKVILAMSELGESGYESRGDLLKAFQSVLRSREEYR